MTNPFYFVNKKIIIKQNKLIFIKIIIFIYIKVKGIKINKIELSNRIKYFTYIYN